MRIAFVYPPYRQGSKFPNLPQNRQFAYTASAKVKLYPVVMALSASRLKKEGHGVLWLDGITRRLAAVEFKSELRQFKPDLVILEAKTPVMRKLWEFIDQLKQEASGTKIALVGDHVSYFPEESLIKSKADYILTGGDYDFLIVNLVQNLTKGDKLKPGIWFRSGQRLKNTGPFELNPLNQVCLIDRQLTRWHDYGEAYLLQPCAYIMSGRGCGIKPGIAGACSFCIWQQALWRCQARLFSPLQVVREVKELVRLGVKEIFDDNESGALADLNWLKEFYRLLQKEKLLGRVIFSSNARADQLTEEICKLLKDLNYRLLKVGLESGNEATLKLINKKETVVEIASGVKTAKDYGLRIMLTIMVGYPWEGEKEVVATYRLAEELLNYKTRAGDCLQASVLVPYPGTPLWQQAKKKGWLLLTGDDYEKYNMGQPVLTSGIEPQYWCRKIWALQRKPGFILKSGFSVRNINEFKLLCLGAVSLLGHLNDYE